MKKTSIFIFFLILYIFGIFINNLSGDLTTSLLVLLSIVVLFLGFCFLKKTYYILSLLSILGFTLGIIVSFLNLNSYEQKNILINNFGEKKQDIEIEIKNVKKIDIDNIVYSGIVLKINNITINKKIKAEVFIKSKNKIKKGTLIKTKAKIYPYKDSDSFKYKKYMSSLGFYFKIYPYNYSSIGYLKQKDDIIINFKNKLLENIKQIYTKEEALFLGGILLGTREELPKNLKNNFNNSGLTHFIAVSGFNITILIVFLSFFIKPLPSYIKFLIISLFIIFFDILVGFSAPVIRASIMGIIGYIVLLSGRKGNPLSIILLSLALMVSFSPLSLNYDISLHLSFLAVIGIVYCQKFYEKKFSFMTNILEIRTALSLTMSALTFTLPIMLFNFGQVSIISPISNILVSWTIPISMLLGSISIIVYNINSFLGIIVGYPSWLLLKWDILIVNFFGSNDFSTIKYDFGKYSSYFEIIYFLIITFIILYFKQKKEPQS